MQNLNWLQENEYSVLDGQTIVWSIYAQYLRSTTWKKLAKENKAIANNICTICGSNKSLRTHHTTYKRVFNETQDDLICICNVCHYKIHNGCTCYKNNKLCATCTYIDSLQKDNK